MNRANYRLSFWTAAFTKCANQTSRVTKFPALLPSVLFSVKLLMLFDVPVGESLIRGILVAGADACECECGC